MLKGAVSTLQQPREQGPLAERRGEKRGGWPALFVPVASGQEGEQEAQCSPRSALPLPTRLVLLGLAKELPENLWLRRAF